MARFVGELGYLRLLKHVLEDGETRTDRTGAGTKSLFSPGSLVFHLASGFPLYTTRKLFFRGIFEEIMFFVQGHTDTQMLRDRGVHIWDGNTSADFLSSQGLDYPEWTMGPLYGFQWRHWGAEYVPAGPAPSGGMDQLKRVLELLHNDPTSRRIVMSSWNVSDLPKMCLAPCHILVQFYVSRSKYLDCHVYQRSADLVAGNPWNVAGYALLTCLLAHVSGLQPGTLILTLGDAHIYTNHVQAAETLLSRTPCHFPGLRITKPCPSGINVDQKLAFIESLQFSDIMLESYDPGDAIKIPFNA